jgi:hypothetical protein
MQLALGQFFCRPQKNKKRRRDEEKWTNNVRIVIWNSIQSDFQCSSDANV